LPKRSTTYIDLYYRILYHTEQHLIKAALGPGCHYLAQELHLDVNFRHLPAECTRKQSVLRMLRAEEQVLDDEDHNDGEDHPYEEDEDQHQEPGPGGKKKEYVLKKN